MSGMTARNAPLAAREHRAEVAPSEDVNVEVRHLLVGGGAVVGQHSVAVLGHPKLAGDPANGGENPATMSAGALALKSSIET